MCVMPRHPRPHRVAVDGQHVETRRGEPHRVAADAATQVRDRMKSGIDKTLGFVGRGGERGRLLNARHIRQQRRGALREFGGGFVAGFDELERDADVVGGVRLA